MSSDRTIERIDLDILLKCLNALDGLETTSITKSEKPDFIITYADKKIGVEHTRAVYQEIVRADKLHFSECPNLPIDQTDLKDRATRRSNEEILRSMTNPFGSWKSSEECWQDWKDKIAQRLNSKREKLNQMDYQLFDENWLLIHDFPPVPDWPHTQSRAGRCLNSLFSRRSDFSRDFDAVFIHSGCHLFEWQNGHLRLANQTIVKPLTFIETALI